MNWDLESAMERIKVTLIAVYWIIPHYTGLFWSIVDFIHLLGVLSPGRGWKVTRANLVRTTVWSEGRGVV